MTQEITEVKAQAFDILMELEKERKAHGDSKSILSSIANMLGFQGEVSFMEMSARIEHLISIENKDRTQEPKFQKEPQLQELPDMVPDAEEVEQTALQDDERRHPVRRASRNPK